jgi:hypothetical protein
MTQASPAAKGSLAVNPPVTPCTGTGTAKNFALLFPTFFGIMKEKTVENDASRPIFSRIRHEQGDENFVGRNYLTHRSTI